ncbi:hypothetical protein [Spirochaeta africana]|uniref:ATP-grasp domain-containing protein n=1 Tax=Spirochaeta africana (strain ATCC 700263 / DSM 8902 / Z-7692) TaxID=889378 RepID=H9UF49_SPIAZ|nr:hypothetical protein [Spirochaeta africana]AFG36142.1 hypothetical protein Spiaf_0033 [Spirochaeta africana DSM 8902]
MSNRAVLVISGFNNRAVIAFCRWATDNAIPFHIVASSQQDPIFLTEYKNRVSITRESPQLSPELFCMWVESMCRQYGYEKIIILPSTEYLNRFLLKNRVAIESAGCAIPLVNEDLYRKISDKYSFSKLCASYGLDVPVEFDQLPESLPFVAKPHSYLSATGSQLIPHLIQDTVELERFRKNEDVSNYFFQEFIFGQSLYLLAYISKENPDNTILFSQENLMQQSKGGSIVLARSSGFHLSEIASRYVAMLGEQNYFGLIMVEVRRDPSRDRYYMIEANPRLWGPMQFCVDNNVDLLGSMLKDNKFEISKPKMFFTPTEYYFWSGGITEHSQPIAYHSYTADDFANNFYKIRQYDIFARKDTIELFINEL